MKNLLTDIAGVRVGHAGDARLASGVTAVTLTDDDRGHGSDLDPDFGEPIRALERREFAGQRHGESHTRAISGFEKLDQ